MSYTATATKSESYSYIDIGNVIRRLTADLVMIASSTATITEANARDYAHDIELLCQKGYLQSVDITLLRFGSEVKAVRYEVDTDAGELTMSKPGGVCWPRTPDGHLRIILSYTSDYTADARSSMASRLNISWVPTSADTSHSSLPSGGSRDYASSTFGMHRKDFGS